MIDHVKQGEKITAAVQNQIIDAANGLDQPAEGDFTTTTKGPLFSKGAAPVSSKQSVVPDMLFQAQNQKTFVMIARPNPESQTPTASYDTDSETITWHVNLPPTQDVLLKQLNNMTNLEVVSAMSINGVGGSSFDVVLDDMQLSSTRNCWFDTCSEAISLNYTLLAGNDNASKGKAVFVITDLDDNQQIEARVSALVQSAGQSAKYKVVASRGIAFNDRARDEQADITIYKDFQVPLSPIDTSVSVDSWLSAFKNEDDQEIGISSLQEKWMTYITEDDNGQPVENVGKVYSIYDFDDLSNNQEFDIEKSSQYDFIMRYVPDEGNKAHVKYVNLNVLWDALSSELSSLSGGVPVDSLGTSGQKSIAWLNNEELELYKMEEDGISVDTKLQRIQDGIGAVLPAESIPDGQGGEQEVEFVIRKGGAGGEIDYAKVNLSAQLSVFTISGDTNEGQNWPQGEHAHRSVETKFNSATGNLYHQLYNFDNNTTESEEFQLSAGVDNFVFPHTYDFVVRKHDSNTLESEVDYLNMNLKMPGISGDSQLVGTRDFSLSCTYAPDGSYMPMLYNWHGGDSKHVHIKTDGGSYYWPQDVQIPTESYYFLVKHWDGRDYTLEYKQLIVDMPDLSGMSADIDYIVDNIYNINTDLVTVHEDIQVLSSALSSLSLSGDYWESGGDHNTCYGSDIGDSNGNMMISLDGAYLNGVWSTMNDFTTGNDHYVNRDLVVQRNAVVGGTLTIGNTTITEAQLSALLQLVQAAPQLLRLV